MTPRILGIRHHSPACARLVARTISEMRPQAVLIEGPSDFNARLGELMLDHVPPLAIYSHSHGVDVPGDGDENGEENKADDGDVRLTGGPAQCWFPLLEHSPEWVALREGRAAGAEVRFIDLPHWRYRALPDDERRTAGQPRSRYARVESLLRERLRQDSSDALWDHLFESPQAETSSEGLARRIDAYFDELRGDDPGTPQDRAREALMAEWVRWAAARHERVLVVCGGWHKPPLDQACATTPDGVWQRPAPEDAPEPVTPVPSDPRRHGSYLVPYSDRQVDALGGYSAGLPSPAYYRWLWRDGAERASDQAMAAIVRRLRRARVAFSTADLTAFERGTRALAALRGRTTPLRVDLLDGLLGAAVKEALETPAPWHTGGPLRPDHHPVLREALLALTGDEIGRLHGDTPQPPLLRDAERRLAEEGLLVTASAQALVLDRRDARDRPRSRLLWQLRVLDIGGVQLRGTAAPGGARSLSPALHFEERWQLRRDDRWHADLIEASVHGATLEAAARQALARRAQAQGGDPQALTGTLLAAIRAGLLDMGEDLAARLREGLPRCHDHGALADAARTMAELARTGFWSDDPRAMLEATLAEIAERLLWLLEDRGTGAPAGSTPNAASASASPPGSASSTPATPPALVEADVRAVSVFDALLRLDLASPSREAVLDTMGRLARGATRPPALRGASLGLAYAQDALGEDQDARGAVMAVLRAMPPRDALGDFLYGLFACARTLATSDDAIARALHATLEAIGTEDFLTALPALRAAMGWLPPRERGALAALAARLMGGANGASSPDATVGALLPTLVGSGRPDLLLTRRIEARAMAAARELGL